MAATPSPYRSVLKVLDNAHVTFPLVGNGYRPHCSDNDVGLAVTFQTVVTRDRKTVSRGAVSPRAQSRSSPETRIPMHDMTGWPRSPSSPILHTFNMNIERLQNLRPLLLVTAILGLVCINGPFLYFALIETDIYNAAMSNGMALVFIAEALLLMCFFAFLIAKLGWKKPGWIFFIAMSLIGSMAFSIPLFLYLKMRPTES